MLPSELSDEIRKTTAALFEARALTDFEQAVDLAEKIAPAAGLTEWWPNKIMLDWAVDNAEDELCAMLGDIKPLAEKHIRDFFSVMRLALEKMATSVGQGKPNHVAAPRRAYSTAA